jgi:peptidoglycan/xylan/chitin deacetylase (PgdA/CDA1 family)
MSTGPTIVTVRYTMSSGSFTYVDLPTLPAAASWTQFTYTLIPPVGATMVSVFHELRSVGTLTVDDYSLTPPGGSGVPNAFNQGMVSLVFDDGWMSHYDTALPILNTANMKGVFGIVTLETLDALPYNRISNPSLEIMGGDGLPVDWFKGGWGTNNAVYNYPVAGTDGANGAFLTISSYTDGDAKWFFKDVTATNGQEYNYSDSYQSDVPTIITVRYNMGSSTYAYLDLATVPASPTWTNVKIKFTVPTGAQSLTVFHRLDRVGYLTIDKVDFSKVQIFVDPAKVLQMQAGGHEISSHTRTHASLTTITPSQMADEVNLSKSDLVSMGVTNVKTFIYPYGDYSPAVEAAAQSAGYIGARSVDRGFNDKATDKFALKTQQMGTTVTFAEAKAWIDTAYDNKTWLTMMFHQIDNSGLSLAMTPALFQQIVDYVASKGIPVVTLEQGISQMNP